MKRSQPRWFRGLFWKCHGSLPKEVFQEYSTKRRLWGAPKNPPRKVWLSLLRLLLPWPGPRKSGWRQEGTKHSYTCSHIFVLVILTILLHPFFHDGFSLILKEFIVLGWHHSHWGHLKVYILHLEWLYVRSLTGNHQRAEKPSFGCDFDISQAWTKTTFPKYPSSPKILIFINAFMTAVKRFQAQWFCKLGKEYWLVRLVSWADSVVLWPLWNPGPPQTPSTPLSILCPRWVWIVIHFSKKKKTTAALLCCTDMKHHNYLQGNVQFFWQKQKRIFGISVLLSYVRGFEVWDMPSLDGWFGSILLERLVSLCLLLFNSSFPLQ